MQNQQSDKEKRLPSLFSYIFYGPNPFFLSPFIFLTPYLILGLYLLLCLLCLGPCFPKIADYLRPPLLKLDAHPKLHWMRICCVANSLSNTSPRPNWASSITFSSLNIWVWAKRVAAKLGAMSCEILDCNLDNVHTWSHSQTASPEDKISTYVDLISGFSFKYKYRYG